MIMLIVSKEVDNAKSVVLAQEEEEARHMTVEKDEDKPRTPSR